MDDKFDRDSELDEMLQPLKNARPKRRHSAGWQAAVSRELQRRSWVRRQMQSLPQLAVGLAMGFLIAAWYLHPAPADKVAENYEPSATILHVFAKAD